MKRVGVAIVLLLFVGIGCLTVLKTEKQFLSSLLLQADRVEESYRRNHPSEAMQAAEALAAETQTAMRRFALFLPHDMLTEIHAVAASLPIILSDGDGEDFLVELAKYRLLLITLRQMEYPRLENIL